jgi:putative ABC transport system ATP-binding protein
MTDRYRRPEPAADPSTDRYRRPDPASDAMVLATGLVRDYDAGGAVVHALRGVSLHVNRGELLAVRGRSGSGKTTLLNLLGGLDQPTAGSVRVDGIEVSGLDERAAAEVRRRTIAFIFQTFGLVPILSAAENVEVPLRLVSTESGERDRRVAELLELVGLEARGGHRPHELSGGEQQRVAIARALANRPRLLLADEPTGQLDSETGRRIMLLIRTVVRAEGVTAIVATHDPVMLEVADRTVELLDGALVTPTADVAAREGSPGV